MNLFNNPATGDDTDVILQSHISSLSAMHDRLIQNLTKISQGLKNGNINRFSTLGYKYFEAYSQLNFKQISENGKNLDSLSAESSQVHLDVDNQAGSKTMASSDDITSNSCSQNKRNKKFARKRAIFSDCESSP